MTAREVVELGADVHAELVHGILDQGELGVQLAHEAIGLVHGEGDEQLAHVREVVVDGRAADAGVAGHMGHGEPGQALLVQQLAEGLEDGVLGVLALLGVGGRLDLGHADTLLPDVAKRSLSEARLTWNLLGMS